MNNKKVKCYMCKKNVVTIQSTARLPDGKEQTIFRTPICLECEKKYFGRW